MPRRSAVFTWIFAGAFFGCFLLWPVVETLRGAFFDASGSLTFAYLGEVFANRIYREGLENALLLALASLGLTLLIALPLAWANDRFAFCGQRFLSVLLLAPMILPPFVAAIGIRRMLGQMGPPNALLHRTDWPAAHANAWLGVGQFWGIVLVNALHFYPLLYLTVAAALAKIDPALKEAAATLGCTGWRGFRRITLPLIVPDVFGGGALVFIGAFTELGVPLMFDYTRVTPVQIFYEITERVGNPQPYALVAVMLAGTLLLYAASKFFFGRLFFTMTKPETVRAAQRLSGWRAVACGAAFGVVIAVALLPHLGVVLTSFAGDWRETVLPESWTLQHYSQALGQELTMPSIANSLKYASLATLLNMITSVAIAFVVARTQIAGRRILDALAMLPLAVPGLALASGYLAMSQPGRAFAFLDPAALLVLAYAMGRLPWTVRVVAAGLQRSSVTLEESARNLGASLWRARCRITLPLLAPTLIAAGLLAFSFAMLEVSASFILAQKSPDFPIARAIYELFTLPGEGRHLAAVPGVAAMIFLALALLAASRVFGKKTGALFRL